MHNFFFFFLFFFFLFAVKNPCDIDTLGSKEWMNFLKRGKYKIINSANVEVSSTSVWDLKEYDKLINEDFLGIFTVHTRKEKNPYVILDLKKVYKIGGILIVNRGDRYGRRTSNLHIDISNDKKKWRNVYNTIFAQDVWETIFKKPVKSRYVKVWLKKKDFLHLAQILIYVDRK